MNRVDPEVDPIIWTRRSLARRKMVDILTERNLGPTLHVNFLHFSTTLISRYIFQ
jgi:hypothetical protein